MSMDIYLLSRGKLHVKDGSVAFEKEDGKIIFFPIKQVENIYINIHNISTPEIIKLVLNEGVLVHYFNNYEYYLGTLIPKNTNCSGKTIVKEIRHYDNKEKRLYLAKEIIIASLKNINRNLLYYKRKKIIDNGLDVQKYVDLIKREKKIFKLMLIEANFRKDYYKNFSLILNIDTFSRNFSGGDLVNSLLNFLNSLLYSVIFSEIMKTKISGQISYVHEIGDNKYPLVYDISDIFKPIIVDRLIFKLINNNELTDDDIKDGRIKEEKIKLIFKKWDKQLNTIIYHKKLKRYISYRDLIKEEVYKIERHLNEIKEYKGFVIWW